MHWTHPLRILSEHLAPLPEPLACLLAPGAVGPAPAVAALGARALLDLTPLALEGKTPWPAWLAPHQVPAAERLTGILGRHGGALLADAVGLGKSYVALAVALALSEPFALVVPAVLVRQWRGLLERYDADAPIITHESLSVNRCRPFPPAAARCRLFIVDEAHRFRNPLTNRYRALAKLVVGAGVLLVTATPVHNRIADLFHLFRLFLRDHDLTGLGVPSLCRAARGDADPHAVTAAAARLSVSRSRERVQAGYDTGPGTLPFPERAAGEAIRVGTAPDVQLQELVTGVAQLEAGGEAAALFRLLLLSQLASSLPAFRASLARYDAFLELGVAAAAQGRALGRRDFRRLFPAGSDDLQLALFPLVLPPGPGAATERDRHVVGRLRAFAASLADPKADALARLLEGRAGKTIVFVQPRATVHYLMPRLRGHRLAAVTGERGWFGNESARREDVLRAFAPRAQGAPLPPLALETDVLIATDLLSEGLNLQDAVRVIHYDLPWSPARLAQRVGRIDRAGSPHERIETVTFLPPPVARRRPGNGAPPGHEAPHAIPSRCRPPRVRLVRSAAGTRRPRGAARRARHLRGGRGGGGGGRACRRTRGAAGASGGGGGRHRRGRSGRPRPRHATARAGGRGGAGSVRPRGAGAGDPTGGAAPPQPTRRARGRALAWGPPGPPQSSAHPLGAGRGTPCRH